MINSEEFKATTYKNIGPLIYIVFMAILIGFSESEYFKINIFSKLPGLLGNVVFGIGFLIWLAEDAKTKKFTYGKVMKFFGLIFPQLTAFYYGFKSRGTKNGALFALKAILFIILSIILFTASMLITDNYLLNENMLNAQ